MPSENEQTTTTNGCREKMIAFQVSFFYLLDVYALLFIYISCTNKRGWKGGRDRGRRPADGPRTSNYSFCCLFFGGLFSLGLLLMLLLKQHILANDANRRRLLLHTTYTVFRSIDFFFSFSYLLKPFIFVRFHRCCPALFRAARDQ